MAVGIGGMLMGLMNRDPSAQLGQALAGPQPNPQPLGGGAPSPQDGSGGIPASATANAPPSTPPQAPAQTYAPDPSNAQNINTLLSLYQNEARANDINRNIALMGSAFGTAQQQHDKLAAIQGMPQGGGGALEAVGEGLKAVTTQQQIELFNQSQQRYADLLRNSDATAKAMGMDPDQFRAAVTAAGPQGAGDLIAKITEAQMGLTGTQLDKEYRQKVRNYQTANPGQPLPTELQSEAAFEESQKTAVQQSQQQATDVREATDALPKLTEKVDEASTIIDRLKKNPNLDTALKIMSAPGGTATAEGQANLGIIDPKTYQAIKDIKQLSGQVYGQGFGQTGSKRTQAEVSAIVSGLSQTGATGYSAPDYISNVLAPLQHQLDLGKAAAYGASGELDQTPKNLRGLVPSQYLPGGSTYSKTKGQGQGWDLDLNPEEVKTASQLIAQGVPREQVIQHILESGKRVPPGL